MPIRLRDRLVKHSLGAIIGLGIVALASTVQAGSTPFSSGPMIAANSGSFTCTCSITNLGTKPVTLSSPIVLIGPSGETQSPTFDDCSSAPLAAKAGCGFGAGGGVYGGGVVQVKGSVKTLRGNCRLQNGSGVVVQILPMR